MIFKIIKPFSINNILDNPYNYRNEICSYNGIPTYNSTTNEVICECNEKYTNEPRKNKLQYINGHLIQCSYERKSRVFVFFLALCVPFGFDFLYLERYLIFSIFFTVIIIMFFANIAIFILNFKINIKKTDTKIQKRFNKMTNCDQNDHINEDNKSIKCLGLVAKLLAINHIIYMSIDLTLHVLGKIPDANHVQTENDFKYLFSHHD
jgi:hypothetical protein